MYKIEKDFEYKNYRCVVIFGDMGHRCGYVGIKPGHPLYKKELTDYLDIPKSELDGKEIGNRSIIPIFFAAFDDDDRIRMDVYFNVHGGLTYSSNNNGTYPVESNLWWLGFDCGHYGDGKDLDLVEKYWGDDPRIQTMLRIEKSYPYTDDEPVRSMDYVTNECKALVNQIIELERRMKV